MSKPHCNSKVIIRVKWMVYSDRKRATQSRAINATMNFTKRHKSISQLWKDWEWHNKHLVLPRSRREVVSTAAFACTESIGCRRQRYALALALCLRQIEGKLLPMETGTPQLIARDLFQSFRMGARRIEVLRGISMELCRA